MAFILQSPQEHQKYNAVSSNNALNGEEFDWTEYFSFSSLSLVSPPPRLLRSVSTFVFYPLAANVFYLLLLLLVRFDWIPGYLVIRGGFSLVQWFTTFFARFADSSESIQLYWSCVYHRISTSLLSLFPFSILFTNLFPLLQSPILIINGCFIASF